MHISSPASHFVILLIGLRQYSSTAHHLNTLWINNTLVRRSSAIYAHQQCLYCTVDAYSRYSPYVQYKVGK